MDKTLTVSLSRTFDGAPLAVVDNLPGGGAEFRPAQLRALAATLQRIADDCKARPVKGRHWAPARREYPLTVAAVASGAIKAAPGMNNRATR